METRSLARADLRDHLARYLPAYMLPAAIVLLDALPLTRHGKIDRAALPSPTDADFRGTRPLRAPRTPIEQRVAALWCDLLGLNAISIDDDFFELGGTSLHAHRLLLHLRESLDIALTMPMLLRAPTIEALADVIAQERATATIAPMATPASAEDASSRSPRLTPQQAHVWQHERFAGALQNNNVHLGFRLRGPLQTAALAQALAMLQQRHEGLRTTFTMDDQGEAVPLTISPEGTPEGRPARLLTVDLCGLDETEREAIARGIARLDHDQPFDLASEVPWRTILVRCAAHEHVLLCTTHHLVCDGWSVGILSNELSMVYADAMRGVPASLPPIAGRYAQFEAQQRAWLESPQAESTLAYWRTQLASPLPRLFTSTAADQLDAPYASVRGRLRITLSRDATEAARQLARVERCTLFAVLLAGITLLLRARTGQPEVRIGTLSANRHVRGMDQVIGLFMNVVCIRTPLEAAWRVRDLIRRVHVTLAEAAAHDQLPFETIARTLAIEQGVDPAGLVEVMMFWPAYPPDALDLPNLDVQTYRPEDDDPLVLARNRLALTFDLTETPTQVTGTITYKTERFTASDIHAFGSALERVLLLARQDPALTVTAACEALTLANQEAR